MRNQNQPQRLFRQVAFAVLIVTALAAHCPAARAADDAKKAGDDKQAQKRPEGAPDEAAVKAEYTKQFATSELNSQNQPYYTYEIQITDLTYGTPHEGDHRADGVPANSKTTVFPVKAVMVVTRTLNSGDHSIKRQRISVKSGFFRDSFGDWTYRTYEEKREDLK